MATGGRVDQRIVSGRQDDIDMLPVRVEFFGQNLGERVMNTLAHFRLRARDADTPRRRDFKVSAEACRCA